MTKEIDITPKTHILASMSKQDMSPVLAIIELVDNCLDANSTKATVEYDPAAKVITISDNGVGAPDPSAIVTMGEHQSEDRSTSGRYGIGAKDAIMSLGTAVEVTTDRNGMRRTVRADFEAILKSGRWTAYGEDEPAPKHASTGTVVRISNVYRRIYAQAVVEHLSATFAPALRRGVKISVNVSEVPPVAEVEVDGRREGTGEIGRKKYRWWAGIKRAGQKVDGGWRFEFKSRVLASTSSNRAFGTEDFDTHMFYGVVTLVEPDEADDDEKWKVNKHKTSAEELEDLCEKILPEVRDLLVKSASEHAITLEAGVADEVGHELTDALSESRLKKERRPGGEERQVGTVLPQKTGRKRKRAGVVQEGEGSVSVGGQFGGKRFTIVMVEDRDDFGWVEGNRHSNKVYLGRQHPYWQQHARDREIVKIAALALLTGHAITTDDGDQPIMSAVVQHDSGEKKFLLTLDNLARQVADRSVEQTAAT
jgi:hypothetical protein